MHYYLSQLISAELLRKQMGTVHFLHVWDTGKNGLRLCVCVCVCVCVCMFVWHILLLPRVIAVHVHVLYMSHTHAYIPECVLTSFHNVQPWVYAHISHAHVHIMLGSGTSITSTISLYINSRSQVVGSCTLFNNLTAALLTLEGTQPIFWDSEVEQYRTWRITTHTGYLFNTSPLPPVYPSLPTWCPHTCLKCLLQSPTYVNVTITFAGS